MRDVGRVDVGEATMVGSELVLLAVPSILLLLLLLVLLELEDLLRGEVELAVPGTQAGVKTGGKIRDEAVLVEGEVKLVLDSGGVHVVDVLVVRVLKGEGFLRGSEAFPVGFVAFGMVAVRRREVGEVGELACSYGVVNGLTGLMKVVVVRQASPHSSSHPETPVRSERRPCRACPSAMIP
jgi:hypothetical protein